MLSLIVAMDRDNVIGDSRTNDIPWHLPNDLKYFKKKTLGHTIVMGRKTFESLGRVLPNRKHIVLSSKQDLVLPKGVKRIEYIQDILAYNKMDPSKEIFIIGGGTLYEQLMPYVDKLYITMVDYTSDGDIRFPKVNLGEWILCSYIKNKANDKNKYRHSFMEYKRAHNK